MVRQSRRKQTGVLSTLMVELSALAGILGIAQPTVRNNLWQMVRPPTINSRANQIGPQESDPFVPKPESYAPTYVPESYQSLYPSAHTARAVKPRDERNPSAWNASGYSPMGTYQ